MADIVTEYRTRHGLPQAIVPVTEGLLFLNNPKNPSKQEMLVVLVSSVSKSHNMCRECHEYMGATVLEVIQPTYYPRFLSSRYHVHFMNEFDLLKEVRAHHGAHWSPVAIPTARDLEQFVWEMFTEWAQASPDLGSSVRHYFLSTKKSKPWIDEAVHFASNHAGTFQHFYDNLYSPLLINRKYLLHTQ